MGISIGLAVATVINVELPNRVLNLEVRERDPEEVEEIGIMTIEIDETIEMAGEGTIGIEEMIGTLVLVIGEGMTATMKIEETIENATMIEVEEMIEIAVITKMIEEVVEKVEEKESAMIEETEEIDRIRERNNNILDLPRCQFHSQLTTLLYNNNNNDNNNNNNNNKKKKKKNTRRTTQQQQQQA